MSAHAIVALLLEDEAEDFLARHLDKMAYPSPEQVTYELHCDEEHIPYEGHFDSGEPELDRQNEEWIRHELARGNQWAWCSTSVIAKWTDPEGNEFEGSDHLGGCSYKSKQDFMQPGGYYDDMKHGAYDELIKAMRKARGGSSEEQRR